MGTMKTIDWLFLFHIRIYYSHILLREKMSIAAAAANNYFELDTASSLR